MVNLEGFKKDTFEGKILTLKEMPLQDYLGTPDKINAFLKGMTKYPDSVNTPEKREEYRESRMLSTVLAVEYAITLEGKETKNSEFFNIPTIRGWGRSKLKSLTDINKLPLDTKDWIGKPVTVHMDKKGYLKLLEE